MGGLNQTFLSLSKSLESTRLYILFKTIKSKTARLGSGWELRLGKRCTVSLKNMKSTVFLNCLNNEYVYIIIKRIEIFYDVYLVEENVMNKMIFL